MMTIFEKLARCSSPGEIKQMVRGTGWELIDSAEVERLRAMLKKHHEWHLGFGDISAPDGKGGHITWSLSEAYAEGTLCDETVHALRSHLDPIEPNPSEGQKT